MESPETDLFKFDSIDDALADLKAGRAVVELTDSDLSRSIVGLAGELVDLTEPSAGAVSPESSQPARTRIRAAGTRARAGRMRIIGRRMTVKSVV